MTNYSAKVFFVAVAVLASLMQLCLAESVYPTRSIKIIVPLPPGPVADALPRIVAQKLAAKWGQPVFVENSTGRFAESRSRSGRKSRIRMDTRCWRRRLVRWLLVNISFPNWVSTRQHSSR